MINTTANNFPPTSRYTSVPTTTYTNPDGREIVHLTRRFAPPPETLAMVREHIVQAGDRIDTIAAQQIGDPEQYWQVADANAAFDPAALTTVFGRRLRITLPQGLPAFPQF
jgi:hypothetical protein